MKFLPTITTSVLMLFSTYASAHHSFAPYAINDPIEVSGTAVSFRFVRPHPVLELTDEDGTLWTMEIAPRNWDNTGLPQSSDIINEGDKMTIRGWPARDGGPEMVIGGFHLNGNYHEITAAIQQRSAVEAAAELDGS